MISGAGVLTLSVGKLPNVSDKFHFFTHKIRDFQHALSDGVIEAPTLGLYTAWPFCLSFGRVGTRQGCDRHDAYN